MLKINNKVWILSSKKLDGNYNRGKIVGIRSVNNYLTFKSETDFYSGIEVSEYQVAYVDVFTKRGYIEWFRVNELSKTKPEG